MKYIVSGPSLGKLIQENRIRISRGELTFTPLVGAASSVEVAENSVEETPMESPKEETPVESPKEETPVESPKEETPNDDISVEETPVEEGKDVAVEDSKDVEPTDTKSPKAKTSKK